MLSPTQHTHLLNKNNPTTTKTMSDNKRELDTVMVADDRDVATGGPMRMVQNMLGAMHAATAGGQGQQTFIPMGAGNVMQQSSVSSDARGQTVRQNIVGASPDAHTTQSYDPSTNTLITTTVDPATDATTTTTITSSTGGGGGGMSSSSMAFAGGHMMGGGGPTAGTLDPSAAAGGAEPPQTTRVTELPAGGEGEGRAMEQDDNPQVVEP